MATCVITTAEILRGPQEVQRSSKTLRRQGRDWTVQLWTRGSSESRAKPSIQVLLNPREYLFSKFIRVRIYSQIVSHVALWKIVTFKNKISSKQTTFSVKLTTLYLTVINFNAHKIRLSVLQLIAFYQKD